MAVDGNGEVSSCGREIGELGFHDDSTGVSVSVSDEEIDILSVGEDIMVGVSGADVFFDGIYGAEGQEEDVSFVRDDEDEYHEFNDFEIRIDETLEIKDNEAYEVQEIHAGGVESEEIISRVRALVQSLPLPGQISPQELELEHSFSLPGQISPQEVVQSFSLPGQICPQEVVNSFSLPDQISPHEVVPVVNAQSSASDNSFKETKFDGNNQTSSALKRKHERKSESSRQKHKDVVFNLMPPMFQEFDDFLNGSTKFQTAEPENKTASMPAQAGEEHCNQNLEKQISEDSKTDLPVSDSLVSPVKHIKDSHWTNMVIQTETESPVKLPAVDALKGCKAHKSVSTRLSADATNKHLSMKTLNNNHVPVAATTDKYSPAELILTFDQMKTIPSESTLNNVFRRFGPLIQTETLIHHESCCARVVFKKSSDAEVAVSSAKVFKFMGPSVVKYELGYTPLSVTSVMQIPESVANSVQEYEQVVTAEDMEPEDMPAQQLQFEQLEEISVAERSVPSESEDYEGLDDVDIME